MYKFLETNPIFFRSLRELNSELKQLKT